MSYARWSDDCYQSDVYVYESDTGFVVHVSTNRYASNERRPTFPRIVTGDSLLRYFQQCSAWVRGATVEPIGLPHDGKTLTADTPKECISILTELQKLGYIVPQRAIDALNEEAK